jgi:hypothetical protein
MAQPRDWLGLSGAHPPRRTRIGLVLQTVFLAHLRRLRVIQRESWTQFLVWEEMDLHSQVRLTHPFIA